MVTQEKFLTEKQVSEITGQAVQTLRNNRHRGRGFRYAKIGRSIRYALSDVLDFMQVHTIETSDTRAQE